MEIELKNQFKKNFLNQYSDTPPIHHSNPYSTKSIIWLISS